MSSDLLSAAKVGGRRPRPRLNPVAGTDEGRFWIARQILRTNDDAQRAAILLSLPDLVVTEQTRELTDACDACQFSDGSAYIALRSSAASANRDARGRLPADLENMLETWRLGMVALAERLSP